MASIGPLSSSVVAIIAVGGVAVLLALITITAFCCNLPARLRRKKAAKETGRESPMMEDLDVEKNEPTVSVTAVDSQASPISKGSQGTRAPSPVCTCECPKPLSPHLHSARLPSRFR
ncbi:hypothetical protein BDU57DRAFT_37681 [Ampelomyces quisqualis]|uniref:Uncharacterized protein n=1 Tax=Ampelomyces quisqualis TaxID=50730 RepID=A0A6A5R2B1_AMPQU|nr:hypothetical protein BDU57DRAFT_37681 [Ampelomyces quisqualis]